MLFKNFVNHFSYDEKVIWTSLAFLLRVLRGPVTIYFVLTYLSLNDQGVYYSFMSLGAMVILAEMGFTRLISIFLLHEFSFLKLKDGFLVGPLAHRSKIFSFISFSFFSIILIVIVSILLLLPVGNYLFRDQPDNIHRAWEWFAIFSGLQLFATFFQSISLGFDHIKISSQNLIYSGIIGTLSLWIGLSCGLAIYSLPISYFLIFLSSTFLFYKNYHFLLKQWLRYKFILDKAYMIDFLKLQLKYAIGFIAGWVVFQLYTPAIFEYFGSQVAGAFGLTVGVIYLLVPFSSIFFNAYAPKITILIAQNSFEQARSMTLKTGLVGFFFYLLCSCFFIFLLIIIQSFPDLSRRILPFDTTLVLILSEAATYIYGVLGVYTRFHKIEVFYKLALIQIAIILFLVFFLLPKVSLFTFFSLIALLQWIIFLPIAFFFFYPYWKKNL